MSAKKILLVDDEPLVQRSIQKTLLRAGYEVEVATGCVDGWRAFETAEQAGTPFNLAVLDLNMPNFDGRESPNAGMDLLSRLLVLRPALPVIVLSAYDEVAKAKEAVNRGACGYCVKSREQHLVKQIAEVLKA
jgi:CheY-like chemotaxis protein